MIQRIKRRLEAVNLFIYLLLQVFPFNGKPHARRKVRPKQHRTPAVYGDAVSGTSIDQRTTSSAGCAEKMPTAPCIVYVRNTWLLPLPSPLFLVGTGSGGSPTGNRKHQTCLIFTIPHQGGCESFGGSNIVSLTPHLSVRANSRLSGLGNVF